MTDWLTERETETQTGRPRNDRLADRERQRHKQNGPEMTDWLTERDRDTNRTAEKWPTG